MLEILYDVAEKLLSLYGWVVIIAAVVSNLIAFGILDTRNRLVWSITDFLYRITEPALRRIRNFMPNLGGIDLSPIILLVIIWVLEALLTKIYISIQLGSVQPLFLG